MRALADLWAGRLPLAAAFWTHAVLICFSANGLATAATMVAIVMELPDAVALAVHLSPAPYTVACAVGVWRSAARYEGHRGWAEAARTGTIFWAGLMLLA